MTLETGRVKSGVTGRRTSEGADLSDRNGRNSVAFEIGGCVGGRRAEFEFGATLAEPRAHLA